LIQVEVNIGPLLSRMARTAAAAHDHTVPNRQIATQLHGWVLRNFQAGGGLQTPPWRPLAGSTLKQKSAKGYSGSPLVRTGHLRQSFRPFSDNDRAGVRSEVPYGQYHESGTSRLPQRAMLPNSEVTIDYAVRIYERWAAQVARTA
jgi:phage gpG-like protein